MTKDPSKTRGWPKARRKAQAERMRTLKPWEKTTGPKTKAGKQAASQNALKHGLYDAETLAVKKWLHAQRKYIKDIGADVSNREPPRPDDCHL